jgi:hypothetical protein
MSVTDSRLNWTVSKMMQCNVHAAIGLEVKLAPQYWQFLDKNLKHLVLSIPESWRRSFPTPNLTCGKLSRPIYCMRECKAVKLAVRLGSVLNWTPCILSIVWRNRGKPQQMSVRVACIRAQILMRYVTNRKQECRHHVRQPTLSASSWHSQWHSVFLVSKWSEIWKGLRLTSDNTEGTPRLVLFLCLCFR